jgi:hypothetical protein
MNNLVSCKTKEVIVTVGKFVEVMDAMSMGLTVSGTQPTTIHDKCKKSHPKNIRTNPNPHVLPQLNIESPMLPKSISNMPNKNSNMVLVWIICVLPLVIMSPPNSSAAWNMPAVFSHPWLMTNLFMTANVASTFRCSITFNIAPFTTAA